MNTNYKSDEDFECFIEEFGLPTHSLPVNEQIIEYFRDKLPGRILEYWQEYGFCGFMNGLFWIVNPQDYKNVLESWLSNTDIPSTDSYHVIARSAFGTLMVWGEKTGFKYKIDSNQGWIIEQDGDEEDISNSEEDFAIKMFFASTLPEDHDINVNNRSLFEQSLSLHGVLAPDEIYCFEPAGFLGGSCQLEDVQKVNIFTHLSLLALFNEKKIVIASL